MINNKQILLISTIGILIVCGIFVGYSMAPTASAEHATCSPYTPVGENEEPKESCFSHHDWEFVFDNITPPGPASNMNQDAGQIYTTLFGGINIVANDHVEEALVDDWKPRHAYPMYRFEHHVFDEDEITLDDDETFLRYDSNDEWSSSWNRMNDDGGWVTSDDERRNSGENTYTPDTALMDVEIPEGSGGQIDFIVYTDGDRDDSDEVARATVTEDDLVGPSQSDTVQASLDIDRSESDGVYWSAVEISRDNTDNGMPTLEEDVILYKNYPVYRLTSQPFTEYPELLQEYNEQTYENFQLDYDFSSSSTIAPRLPDIRFEDAEEIDDGHYEGEDVFTNAYIEVSNVEPSIYTKHNDIRSLVIGNEGNIDTIYDATYHGAPSEEPGPDDPDDGDIRWDYTTSSLDYEPEVGFIHSPFNPTETAITDDYTTSSPGHTSVDYDEDDLPYDVSSIYAELDIVAEIDVDYDEYVVNWEDCPDDNSGENTSYSDWVWISDCDSPSEEYIQSEGWEDYDGVPSSYRRESGQKPFPWNGLQYRFSDYQESVSGVRHTESVAGSEDDNDLTVDDDDFDIQIASMPGGNEIHMDRDEQSDVDWTRMEMRGIDVRETLFPSEGDDASIRVPTASASQEVQSAGTVDIDGVGDDIEIGEGVDAIPGYVSDDINVTVEVFGYGSYNGNVEINVEDESISDSYRVVNRDTYDSYSEFVVEKDITDIVEGQSSIDISATYDGDSSPQPRLDYIITFESDKAVKALDSRHNYATFRDSRWDMKYEFTERCDEECFDYRYHGFPLQRGDDHMDAMNDLPDEVSEVHYPPRAQPVHAYLIPTSDSILTQRTNREVDIRLPNTDPELYHLAADASEDHYNDDVFQSYANMPLDSNRCPEHTFADNQTLCNIQDGYVASHDVESRYIRNHEPIDDDFTPSEDLDGVSNPEEGFDEDYGLRPSMLNMSDVYSYSNYEPLYEEDERLYYEISNFIVEGDENLASVSMAGDAMWHSEDMETNERHMFDRAELSMDFIEYDDMSEERINELESQDADHVFVDEVRNNHSFDSENMTVQQIELTLRDEYGVPIDLQDIDKEITVQSSTLVNEDWTSREISRTNDDGQVYVVVGDTHGDSNSGSINVSFSGHKDSWWEQDSNQRLLTSADLTRGDVYPDDESGELGLMNLIMVLIIIFGGFLVITSMAFRIHPESNVTPKELFDVMFEPFKDPLGEFMKGLLYMAVFTIGLLAVTNVFGAEINPFRVFDWFEFDFDFFD